VTALYTGLKEAFFACVPGLPALSPAAAAAAAEAASTASAVQAFALNRSRQTLPSAAAAAAPAAASTLASVSAALAPVPLPDLAPAAVEARVALTVTKLRALELLVLALCGPDSLRIQRLLLADMHLKDAIFSELSAFLPDVVPYLAAHAAATAEKPLDAEPEGAVEGDAEGTVTKGGPDDDAAATAGGPNAASEAETIAVSVSAHDGRAWGSEAEAFAARPGHAVEELAKVDYTITLLTVVHRAFDGAHALGPARTHFGTPEHTQTH
jgi:hypothetical protein